MQEQIPAPIHSMFPEVAAWLTQRGAEGLAPDLQYSAVFSEQSLEPGTQELAEFWETGAWISWLGGPAVDPGGWPCNAEGRPLAHVATFHLGGVDALHVESRRAWPQEQIQEGLPTEGVLQVFHDLQTYGYGLEDSQARGWLVQWLPGPEQDASRRPLVRPPEDVEVPSEVCQPGLFMPGFTLPSSLEHRDDQAHSFEQHDELVEELAGSWQVQRGLEPTPGWTIPFTHVYGHSSSGSAVPLAGRGSAGGTAPGGGGRTPAGVGDRVVDHAERVVRGRVQPGGVDARLGPGPAPLRPRLVHDPHRLRQLVLFEQRAAGTLETCG